MASIFNYFYLIIFIRTVYSVQYSSCVDSFTKSVNESNGYYYKPPERINYTGITGKNIIYPLYNFSEIPLYIFEYRTSENKYRKLLAGLALYNLGNIYSNPKMLAFHEEYISRSDTKCTFKVFYAEVEDEMEVFCGAMTSFIIFMSFPKRPISDPNLPETADGSSDENIKNKHDGQPINLEALSGKVECSVETRDKSDRVPCDLLELYATLSLLRVSRNANASDKYHYAPPDGIVYAGSKMADKFKKGIYPVYKELEIPSFVFEYRTSKNKYREYLAGLALYNLAFVFSNSSKKIRDFHEEYVTHKYSQCMFSVVDRDSDINDSYDTMNITCEAITSFIYKKHNNSDFSVSIDDVIDSTAKNIDDPKFVGDLVNTTGLQCFVENTNRKSLELTEDVPCDLLALYAEKSLLSHSAVSKSNMFLVLLLLVNAKLLI